MFSGGAGLVGAEQGGDVEPPPGEEVDHLDLQEDQGGAVRPLQQPRGLHWQVHKSFKETVNPVFNCGIIMSVKRFSTKWLKS